MLGIVRYVFRAFMQNISVVPNNLNLMQFDYLNINVNFIESQMAKAIYLILHMTNIGNYNLICMIENVIFIHEMC